MPQLRFHFPSTKTGTSPLAEVCREAAQAAGCNQAQMATAMSFFFEKLADKVASGKAVSIDGFGQFSPWACQNKVSGEKYVAPRFVAHRGFRNLVKVSCLLSNACNVQAEYYRASNSRRVVTTRDRTFVAQASFRQQIIAQAEKNLMEHRFGV
jgi:hypothetical protein